MNAAAEPPSSRLRAIGRIAVLILWFLYCLPPHLIMRMVGRSRWPRRFLGGSAAICGADVRITGDPVASHTLLIANHISWLDIFVLAGATGCAFMSKAEVRDHPVLKWFADQNRTLYIRRSHRRGIGDQAAAMIAALKKSQPLALFPEGTTGDGHRLLPFRPALLSAVAPAPAGVAVRPVAIDYGRAASRLGWAGGEGGLANALRILGRPGRIAVIVRLLEPLPPSVDRKLLAQQAQMAIAAALTPSGIAPAGL